MYLMSSVYVFYHMYLCIYIYIHIYIYVYFISRLLPFAEWDKGSASRGQPLKPVRKDDFRGQDSVQFDGLPQFMAGTRLE